MIIHCDAIRVNKKIEMKLNMGSGCLPTARRKNLQKFSKDVAVIFFRFCTDQSGTDL